MTTPAMRVEDLLQLAEAHPRLDPQGAPAGVNGDEAIVALEGQHDVARHGLIAERVTGAHDTEPLGVAHHLTELGLSRRRGVKARPRRGLTVPVGPATELVAAVVQGGPAGAADVRQRVGRVDPPGPHRLDEAHQPNVSRAYDIARARRWAW